MKKISFFSIILLLFSLFAQKDLLCQDAINFGYDNNGNRISRVLVTLRSATVKFPVTEEDFKEKLYEEEPSDLIFKVYPNPTSGLIIIEHDLNEASVEYDYSIFNLNGNSLLKGKLRSGYNELNISGLKNGLYIFRIKQGNIIKDWKIIKSGY